MNIESLARIASPQNAVGLTMLKKGMDQQQSQVAQLLQAMPQAPQPAHLGQNVDMKL